MYSPLPLLSIFFKETIFKLLNLESNSFFAPFNVKFNMYNLGKKFINNIIKVMIHTALFFNKLIIIIIINRNRKVEEDTPYVCCKEWPLPSCSISPEAWC